MSERRHNKWLGTLPKDAIEIEAPSKADMKEGLLTLDSLLYVDIGCAELVVGDS